MGEKGRCVPDVTFTAAWSADYSSINLVFSEFVSFYDPWATKIPDNATCVNPGEQALCESNWEMMSQSEVSSKLKSITDRLSQVFTDWLM